MIRSKQNIICLLIPLFLLSCYSTKNNTTGYSNVQNTLAPCSGDGCTIKGTVVRIYSERDTTDLSSPCAKAPCKAEISIDEVLSRGSRFTGNIAAGNNVEMSFLYTLSATTKELFPNLERRYPGLKTGSRFKANVQCRIQPGSDDPRYIVYEYILL